MTKFSENEIKEYLQIALANEKLANFSFEFVGESKKGDGYMGDILFVQVTGEKGDSTKNVYNLVLKCGKRNKVLRKTIPIREAFENEIIFYTKIIPAFIQFQEERGIYDALDLVPKCYDAFTLEDVEVIVLENVKEKGYNLWDRYKPQTRDQIDLIMKGYAKYHALSLAFSDQQPQKFADLSKDLHNLMDAFIQGADIHGIMTIAFGDVHQLLKNEVSEDVLERWSKFKDEVKYVIGDMEKETCVRVFTHGDCWNNNFMFKPSVRGEKHPEKAVFLDFQNCRLYTLVSDLSYFLYTCASEEDINDLEVILKNYHQHLSEYIEKLGSNPEKLYSYNVFLSEWKRFSKFGLAMVPTIMKICFYEKDETFDISEETEKGNRALQGFLAKIKNEQPYKLRVKYLIEGAIKNGTL